MGSVSYIAVTARDGDRWMHHAADPASGSGRSGLPESVCGVTVFGGVGGLEWPRGVRPPHCAPCLYATGYIPDDRNPNGFRPR